jgi:hypothetical protein
MNTEIKIIELRPMPGDKPLRAFVDIQIGAWTIREWRVIKDNGKRPWVAPPQLSWKGPDGRIQYKTIVTLPDELKVEIDQVILNRYIGEMEKKKSER